MLKPDRLTKAARFLVAATAVLAVAACSVQAPLVTTASEPPLGEKAAQVRSEADLVPLPAVAYLLTPEELAVVSNAASRLKVRCAAQAGVKYEYLPSTAESHREGYRAQSSGRYGFIEPEEVERAYTGWQNMGPEPGKFEGVPPTEFEQQTFDRCEEEVGRAFGGGQAFALSAEVMSDSYGRMLNDSRFLAAERAWAACMKRAGYDVRHRWETGGDWDEKGPEAAIAAGLVNIECARETGFVETANAVDVAIQKQLINAKAASFQQAKAENDALVAKAKDFVRGG